MEHRNQIRRNKMHRISNDFDMKNLAEIFTEIAKEYPNSKLDEIIDVVEDQRGFGSMELDPIMDTSYYISYNYYSPETDIEYENRMISQEKEKKRIEEREKLDYLRLKAKFENK